MPRFQHYNDPNVILFAKALIMVANEASSDLIDRQDTHLDNWDFPNAADMSSALEGFVLELPAYSDIFHFDVKLNNCLPDPLKEYVRCVRSLGKLYLKISNRLPHLISVKTSRTLEEATEALNEAQRNRIDALNARIQIPLTGNNIVISLADQMPLFFMRRSAAGPVTHVINFYNNSLQPDSNLSSAGSASQAQSVLPPTPSRPVTQSGTGSALSNNPAIRDFLDALIKVANGSFHAYNAYNHSGVEILPTTAWSYSFSNPDMASIISEPISSATKDMYMICFGQLMRRSKAILGNSFTLSDRRIAGSELYTVMITVTAAVLNHIQWCELETPSFDQLEGLQMGRPVNIQENDICHTLRLLGSSDSPHNDDVFLIFRNSAGIVSHCCHIVLATYQNLMRPSVANPPVRTPVRQEETAPPDYANSLFTCPLTGRAFADPITLNGVNYDREGLRAWMSANLERTPPSIRAEGFFILPCGHNEVTVAQTIVDDLPTNLQFKSVLEALKRAQSQAPVARQGSASIRP